LSATSLLPSGPTGLLIAATVVAVLLSETTSNTASANMVIPVVIAVARAANVDPVLPRAMGWKNFLPAGGGVMSNTGRRIYAVLAALAVAWTIVFLIETLANRMAPLPPGVNPLDSDQLKRALEAGEIPFSSLALVLGGWLLGAYAGGTVAARLGGPGKAALVFTMLFTTVVVVNLLALPHPIWMWIGGCLGVPLLALGAAGDSITIRR